MVKGDGGAVGLTDNPNALRRWMLSGPEMARLVNEFEACVAPEACHDASYHHEAQKSFQVAFHQDVKSLVQVYEDFGDPFDEESADLVVLDSKVVADKEGVLGMQQVEELGRKRCEKFIQESLVERKTPLDEPITRNKLDFFSTTSRKKKSKVNQKLSSMKSDCSLFSRLFIACQTRNGDLDDFFRHENQGCPPSLSDEGNLRLPRQKSELANCLEALTTPQIFPPANGDVIRPTGTERTFSGCATATFVPYVIAQLRHVKRVDIVWDTYIGGGLKATTRSLRGAGLRQRVAPDNQLPRSWKDFLRVDQNKQELFQFLAQCVTSIDSECQVISSHGEQVLSSHPRDDTSTLAPCTHQEGDTRMFLHVADAVQCGFTRIIVRTVDTDVLVLAVSLVQQLQDRSRQAKISSSG
jgi:hypothetical protein